MRLFQFDMRGIQVVGQYCTGDSDLIVPPPKDTSTPEVLYDSAVDVCENPNIFVVFFDNQCYPEYLITFQWTHSTSLSTKAAPGNKLHGTHAVLQRPQGHHESHEVSTSRMWRELKHLWAALSYTTQLRDSFNVHPNLSKWISLLHPALDYYFCFVRVKWILVR